MARFTKRRKTSTGVGRERNEFTPSKQPALSRFRQWDSATRYQNKKCPTTETIIYFFK